MDQYLLTLDAEAPHLDLSGYLFYGVIGAVYFVVQHAVLHVVLRMLYPRYNKMNSHDFHEYRMQVNALVHACCATSFAIYCIYFTCQDGKTFMNDENCRLVPRNSHVWLCFFTASYLFVETVFIALYVGVTNRIDKQTLIHHVIGFLNYYIAFWQ